MKKELLSFDNYINNIKKSLYTEESDGQSSVDADIDVSATCTIDDKEVPVNTSISISEDTEEYFQPDEIKPQQEIISNQTLTSLKEILENMLIDSKKKAYAARLYSKNSGNQDALKDYGYYLGQKDVLYFVLKELSKLELAGEIDHE